MRRTTFLLLGAVFWACNSDTFVEDGGTDTGSDTIVIGGGDGGSTDGAMGKDVSTTPKRFCEQVDAQFCADFDIPNDAGAGFAPPVITNGWALHFQQTQRQSVPVALQIDTLGDASGSAYVENPQLAQTNGPATRMVVEADVYLPTAAFTPDAIFVLRAGVIPLKGMTFGLAAHAGAWKLMRGGNNVLAVLSPPPATDQWVHAVLGIDISATNGNVTLDIGPAHASASVITGVDGGTTYPGYLAAGADDMYIPQNGLTFYVDNVIVRWQ